MQAGRLRHRVTIQYQAVTRDAYGAEEITWLDVATDVPADVRSLSGLERLQPGAGQVVGLVIYSVLVRYRSGINVKMRVIWESKVLEINEVLDKENRGRELFMRCTEILD